MTLFLSFPHPPALFTPFNLLLSLFPIGFIFYLFHPLSHLNLLLLLFPSPPMLHHPPGCGGSRNKNSDHRLEEASGDRAGRWQMSGWYLRGCQSLQNVFQSSLVSADTHTHTHIHASAPAPLFSLSASSCLPLPGNVRCRVMIDGLRSETEQPPLFVCLCYAWLQNDSRDQLV